jgi:hypothetical protein
VAETVTVVTIVPWPHFQAFVDAQAAIGGQLYSYEPATSTPKATYTDPGLVTAQTNPVILDDQGSASVYLDGLYRLRFTDATGTLYWEVDHYQFPASIDPPPGALIMGSTEATLQPSPGAATLTFPNMAPAGYRVLGTTWTLTVEFGTSTGLSGILLGDAVAIDRWARITNLSAGQTSGQLAFRAGDQPIAAPTAYTLLAVAEGGVFDGTGSLHVTVWWEALPADTP